MREQTLVIGATGLIGHFVAEGLRTRGAAVRLATRHAPEMVDAGWVHFDFAKPETFAGAVRGVARVFLIARPGDPQPEVIAAPLIAAMKQARVQHVVNLTAMGVESREDIGLRKVERLLESSGMGFTHLRPNFFMQVFTMEPLRSMLRGDGVIRVPAANARISYVDARDVAAGRSSRWPVLCDGTSDLTVQAANFTQIAEESL